MTISSSRPPDGRRHPPRRRALGAARLASVLRGLALFTWISAPACHAIAADGNRDADATQLFANASLPDDSPSDPTDPLTPSQSDEGDLPAPTPSTPAAPSQPPRRPTVSPFSLGSSASTLGGARGPQSTTPFMIGDFFGAGHSTITIANPANGGKEGTTFVVPTGGAQLVGVSKIAENCSPLPRDRVFFNYSMFDGVPLTAGGVNINRFTPGFEKTFFDRQTSIEVRLPFAATIGPNFDTTSGGSLITPQNVVFGDMNLYFKALLYSREEFSFSGGLQLALPTAPGTSFSLAGATPPLVQVRNQSVHAMPFIGAIFTPNERFFAQGFFEIDVDTNGNSVLLSPTGLPPATAGRLRDPTFMYVSLGGGYWLSRDNRSQGLTGLAVTLEAHYNQSLQPGDVLSSSGITVGAPFSQVSVLNTTVGCYFKFNQLTTITLGYTTPIGNGVDKQFNGELRAFVNRRFGTSTRASRVNF